MGQLMIVRVLVAAMALAVAGWPALALTPASPPPAVGLADNAESIAVVIGNKSYRQTVPVDFAHNDADAMRDYLVRSLGFRDTNVFVLKDATLNEFNQVFGTERNPQSGRLWRSVREGRSNVFVYFSGHGVPDLATRQPFLLPHDGDPNQGESGYGLDLLYRNLDLVRQKIGPERQLVVMIDACFTGETGRRGETLLAVSAPGFAPARPKTGPGVIKLVATSGTHPANWDDEAKLGLFTSRFLMGAAGLADDTRAGGNGDGAVQWPELQAYLKDEVARAARRATGRDQVPEVDIAALTLKADPPVPAVARPVAASRDAAAWAEAEAAATPEAFERYIGRCGEVCAHREQATTRLAALGRADAAALDERNWQRLSRAGRYRDYLDQCGAVCAYRGLAEGYLGGDPARDPRVRRCDEVAATPGDPDKPKDVRGVSALRLDAPAAVAACEPALAAHPTVGRLAYQLGNAYSKLGRHKDAADAFRRATEAGHVGAFNNLAAAYATGRGVTRSVDEAARLLRQGAERGNANAMRNYAALLDARPEATAKAEAARWYQRAAERGNFSAVLEMFRLYQLGGPGLARDPAKAYALVRQAADRGDPEALAAAAVLIDNGDGRHFPGRSVNGLMLQALKAGVPGAEALATAEVWGKRLKPESIRTLQLALQKAQVYDGPTDGAFNPVFVRAITTVAQANETTR